MLAAEELETVAPGLWIWQAYDPAVKADLFSTAIATKSGIYLVDPIPLRPKALCNLTNFGAVSGIVITNQNHTRACDQFAATFRTAVYDPSTSEGDLTGIPIDGGPLGEMAVYCPSEGGTVIVGDALINSEPYGFALLPAKYCTNLKLMRASLPRLLDYSFTRILFAHGTPITSRARERLEELLQHR